MLLGGSCVGLEACVPLRFLRKQIYTMAEPDFLVAGSGVIISRCAL